MYGGLLAGIRTAAIWLIVEDLQQTQPFLSLWLFILCGICQVSQRHLFSQRCWCLHAFSKESGHLIENYVNLQQKVVLTYIFCMPWSSAWRPDWKPVWTHTVKLQQKVVLTFIFCVHRSSASRPESEPIWTHSLSCYLINCLCFIQVGNLRGIPYEPLETTFYLWLYGSATSSF